MAITYIDDNKFSKGVRNYKLAGFLRSNNFTIIKLKQARPHSKRTARIFLGKTEFNKLLKWAR